MVLMANRYALMWVIIMITPTKKAMAPMVLSRLFISVFNFTVVLMQTNPIKCPRIISKFNTLKKSRLSG